MPLTYPVDYENDRFDVWDTDTSALIEKRNLRWPRADGMGIEGLPANLIPLLRIQGVDPAYDPATHYLTRPAEPVVDLVAQTSDYTRVAVAYTQAQLDALAEQQVNEDEADLLRAAYIKFKNGNGTNAEVQRAVAWLIKNAAGL